MVAQNRKGVGPPSLSAPFTWWPTFNPVVAARLDDTRVGAGGGLVDVGVGRVVPGSSLAVWLVGVGGRLCFDASAPVHVIADINGWFATGN